MLLTNILLALLLIPSGAMSLSCSEAIEIDAVLTEFAKEAKLSVRQTEQIRRDLYKTAPRGCRLQKTLYKDQSKTVLPSKSRLGSL
jgi:hypothetical protein